MLNAYERGQKFLCGDYSQYTPTGKDYLAVYKRQICGHSWGKQPGAASRPEAD